MESPTTGGSPADDAAPSTTDTAAPDASSTAAPPTFVTTALIDSIARSLAGSLSEPARARAAALYVARGIVAPDASGATYQAKADADDLITVAEYICAGVPTQLVDVAARMQQGVRPPDPYGPPGGGQG